MSGDKQDMQGCVITNQDDGCIFILAANKQGKHRGYRGTY